MAEGKRVLLSTVEVEGFIDAATMVYDHNAYDPIIKAMISQGITTEHGLMHPKHTKKIKVRAFIEVVDIDD
jgi:hypothetical protein